MEKELRRNCDTTFYLATDSEEDKSRITRQFGDRVFFSASEHFQYKPAACVVNCRRGGASATFDRLNKYFTILQMPVVSSQYWNSTHGFTPDEVRRDLEGLQTMRTLGNNMAYLLKSMAQANLPRPPQEPKIATNFIS